MKRIASFAILVLGLCFFIQAQTNYVTNLESLPTARGKFAPNGLKKGYWIYYQSSGLKAKEGRYLPRIVKDSVWYIDVETFMEVADTFYEEQKIGKWKYFNEKEELRSVTVYSKKTGEKKSICYSEHGLASFEKRKKNHYAVRKSYYENGNREWVANYNKDNTINGRFREWNEEGRLLEKGRYENGEKIGKWKIWNAKEGNYQIRVFPK